MKMTKVMALLFIAGSISASCMGCCGMCRSAEVSESQQQMLDEAAAKRYALQRDADIAYRLAQQDMETQRRRAVAVEQQRLLDDASRKKRQEARDVELARRIAEQELYEQKRRATEEQQRSFAANAARQRQEQRDAELARRIAQQELDMQATHVVMEQQYLLDEAAGRKRQENRDADLAQRIAQQELAAQRAQQDNAKRQQITADAALAQQLQAEEFMAARDKGKKHAHAAPAPMPTKRIAGMTSALPGTVNANNLKNWVQSNDIMPKAIAPDDVLCAVCIATAKELEGNQVVKLPCKHVFCRACTRGLVATQAEVLVCPTCRDISEIAGTKALVR